MGWFRERFQDCVIMAAQIGAYVHIGHDAVVGRSVILRDCVQVLPNTVVPPDAVIPPFSIVGGNPGFPFSSLILTIRVLTCRGHRKGDGDLILLLKWGCGCEKIFLKEELSSSDVAFYLFTNLLVHLIIRLPILTSQSGKICTRYGRFRFPILFQLARSRFPSIFFFPREQSIRSIDFTSFNELRIRVETSGVFFIFMK